VTGRAPRFSDDPFSWDFFEEHGAFPIMMDRHASEFFPERFPKGSYYGKTLGIDAYPIDKRIAWGDEVYEEFTRVAHSDEPLPPDFFEQVPGEHEQLLEIITSVLTDTRQTFSVNLPNEGAVPNLPSEAVLELPAAATARGFCQLHAGPLPEALAVMLKPKIEAIDLTVEAALAGSETLFVEALLLDGAVRDRGTARRLARDLLEAHREHLPQFAA
jgi:alpha-galactosidase